MKPLLALLIIPALTGCVVFPHGEWVAPPASGQVLDAGDRQPVAQAKVTRYIEAFDRKRVVSTDAHGNFDLKKRLVQQDPYSDRGLPEIHKKEFSRVNLLAATGESPIQ